MFDFFRDVYLELTGVDTEKVNEERKLKKEEMKKNKFIFSLKMKIVIYVFGILYLAIAGLNIWILIENKTLNAVSIIRYLVLSTTDIAALVCLSVGEKKTEIAALVFVIVFAILQYAAVLLL